MPRFDCAQRLPVNFERLQQRLRMLSDDDFRIVESAQHFLFWHHHPMERTNLEFAEHYRQIRQLVQQPVILDILEYRMDVRTIVAALRRRHYKHPAPDRGDSWGVGQWLSHIEKHWQEPDFGLASVYPWIEEVARLLEDDQPLQLEKRLLTLIWNYLDRHDTHGMFSLEAVIIYLFKWDIVNRWLMYQPHQAKLRFDRLANRTLTRYAATTSH
jgi:hypothetical protein